MEGTLVQVTGGNWIAIIQWFQKERDLGICSSAVGKPLGISVSNTENE